MKTSKNIIIFDFLRTIYDPEEKKLVPYAREILTKFSEMQFYLVLVSRDEGWRKEVLQEYSLGHYFSEIHFVEDKSETLFSKISAGSSPCVWVIGDYLHSEIAIGQKLGMKTIWLRSGKFKDIETLSVRPLHTVSSLQEVLSIIR